MIALAQEKPFALKTHQDVSPPPYMAHAENSDMSCRSDTNVNPGYNEISCSP